MERRFKFSEGEYYHVYNRGVEKRTIFQDTNDLRRFQELLFIANGDKPVVYKNIQGAPFAWDRGVMRSSILAYSLMPNHFHLIVRENVEGGLSKFMGKLATSYSMYFNTRHERTGALMHHPFRARHIDGDDYFRWVLSYVHLNPILEDDRLDVEVAARKLRTFEYSSYPDYFLGERAAGAVLHKDAMPIPLNDLENVETMLHEFSLRELERQG